MTGCKHPLTNFALLLILFLLYAVYPIPFITSNNFQLSEDFLLIQTSAAIAILLTAIIGNALCLVVFVRLQNPARYLYVLMLVADIIHPFCYLPGEIIENWRVHNRFKGKPHAEYQEWLDLQESPHWLEIYYSVRQGVVTFSLLCYTLVCILDFYTSARQMRREKIQSSVKLLTVGLSVIFSFLLSYFYHYMHSHRKWHKAIDLSMLSFFIPIIMCTIYLVVSYLIRNCFQKVPEHSTSSSFISTASDVGGGRDSASSLRQQLIYEPSYRFIWTMWASYIVFYSPWFVWMYLRDHGHPGALDHAMNTLVLIKSCANVFLMIEFDKKLKEQLQAFYFITYSSCLAWLRRNCCCCCQPLSSYISASKDRFREKISLNSSNTFIVVETANGEVTLQNGNKTSRSLFISSV